MELLCVLGIYLLACRNLPVVAALVFSMAISLKAGAILYLPALLGVIQYRHGVFKLLLSILVMVSWQYAVAAPFIAPEYGGQTSPMMYLHMSKLLGGDGKGGAYGWGATFEWSIYWRFIP
jgi:uncharacterized membrane protein